MSRQTLPRGLRSLTPADLKLEDDGRCFKYNVYELACSFKAALLKHILRQERCDKVIYLDSDIWVCADLSGVFRSLEGHNAILTPHITRDFRNYSEREVDIFLRCGLFNLGFFAVRGGDETLRLLDWWDDMLKEDCSCDFIRPLFCRSKDHGFRAYLIRSGPC